MDPFLSAPAIRYGNSLISTHSFIEEEEEEGGGGGITIIATLHVGISTKMWKMFFLLVKLSFDTCSLVNLPFDTSFHTGTGMLFASNQKGNGRQWNSAVTGQCALLL